MRISKAIMILLWSLSTSNGQELTVLVEKVAAALDADYDIEVVESHHRHKVDAPSGTALMLGEAAAAGRGVSLSDVEDRARDGITESRLVYEIFYAYFLPQFEGMEERRAMTLYRSVAAHLDAPEQLEAQRTISDVLGVELVV